ncbi:MAG: bacteriohemerythrin, partial [Deltaproteobacteria bacterium]|nr:bacteriohemerythrin [Deltaproteobacteria bacterium]
LINLINKLYDALSIGDSRSVLGDIFNELTLYINKHLLFEESLFDKFGFPGGGEHKIIHQNLAKRVMELKKSFESDENLMIGIDTMNLLREWLSRHILEEDKKYVEFFSTKDI